MPLVPHLASPRSPAAERRRAVRPPRQRPGRHPLLAALLLMLTAGAFGAVCGPAAAAVPGEAVWSARFSSNALGDEYKSVVAGPNDTVYAAGVTKATEESSLLLLVKYRDLGASVSRSWVRTYKWPGRYGSAADAVAVDGAGNVIVAGTIGITPTASVNGRDILVLKYGPGGALKWAKRYDGSAHKDDTVSGVVVDGAGNAYVAGTVSNSGKGRDYVVLKYRGSDGQRLWAEGYGGTSWDHTGGIAIDSSRNVYVTGASRRNGIAAATLKISPSGSRLWTKRVEAGAGLTYGNAIVVSPAGGVYIGGDAAGGMSTRTQMLVARLSRSTGAVQWSSLIGEDGDETGRDLAADSTGNAVCVGGATDAGQAMNALMARVSPAGATLWTRQVWFDDVNNDAHFQTVAVTGAGDVFAGGYGTRVMSGADFLVSSVGPNNTYAWTYQRNGSASGDDICRDVALRAGGVYAAGVTTTEAGGMDACLVKILR